MYNPVAIASLIVLPLTALTRSLLSSAVTFFPVALITASGSYLPNFTFGVILATALCFCAETSEGFLSAIDFTKKFKDSEATNSFKYLNDEELLNKIIKKDVVKENIKNKLPSKYPQKTIYVVDDEDDLLDLIEIMLTQNGFNVLTFNNPELVISEIKKGGHPDTILTDISMPQMTGLQLLAEVNKIRPYIPFIILSGFVSKEACLDAISKGVQGIIEKPFDEDKLYEVLTKTVSRYQSFRLLNASIDLLVNQFKEFDKFLKSKDEKLCETFRNDLKNILSAKKSLMSRAI